MMNLSQVSLALTKREEKDRQAICKKVGWVIQGQDGDENLPDVEFVLDFTRETGSERKVHEDSLLDHLNFRIKPINLTRTQRKR